MGEAVADCLQYQVSPIPNLQLLAQHKASQKRLYIQPPLWLGMAMGPCSGQLYISLKDYVWLQKSILSREREHAFLLPVLLPLSRMKMQWLELQQEFWFMR